MLSEAVIPMLRKGDELKEYLSRGMKAGCMAIALKNLKIMLCERNGNYFSMAQQLMFLFC